MKSTHALVFEKFGPPAEVLQLIEEPLPETGPGEVKVRMIASPINPSDLNYIEGTYGLKPGLPAHAGLEGAGEVVEVGPGVEGVSEGDLVSAPRQLGNWREAFVAPAADLRVFPKGLKPEQAAMFHINPLTAWAFLHEIVPLQPGAWIVQNAATSAVGRQVIALAHKLGLRTVNLVRKADDIPLLKALGADVVAVTEGADAGAIREEMGKGKALLGLNAVGGESAALVSKLLAPGGVHVTYGAMSRQPVKVSNGALIFSAMTYRGFWLTHWLKGVSPARLAEAEAMVADCFREGIFQAEVAGKYSLNEYKEALASIGKERGKNLFQLSV
ncbi:NADPH:quinone reductase [Verrucomicrobium sp. GAS474]|uniref:MDR family NADPH-dependent oxidoreductase n=1 Tax=Verrucomicrobium sp. GAS474 TaxID=1882831 RepID=UPI00087BE625|nr:2-enoyl thioester reductase domain-containing protein [Verrucomicrobium sp. GAS474]SDU24230.1 NADPH:quinone reductase [Verrucomicrobium sp. GAS474]